MYNACIGHEVRDLVTQGIKDYHPTPTPYPLYTLTEEKLGYHKVMFRITIAIPTNCNKAPKVQSRIK